MKRLWHQVPEWMIVSSSHTEAAWMAFIIIKNIFKGHKFRFRYQSVPVDILLIMIL